MKGLKGYFEVFKVGKHTDRFGKTKEFSEDDLKGIAASYDPSVHEAPLVVGHPKDNTPAYGWVKDMKVEDGKLYAKASQVVQEFSDAVEQGLYKKRSIALYPDGKLRHIGFLGGTPPAIKGLKDIEFNESDSGEEFEFADWETNAKFKSIGDTLQSLKDFTIEKYGKDEADKIFEQWDLDFIKKEIPNDNKSEFAEESPEVKELREKNKQLEQHLANMAKEKRRSEINEFCECLVGDGKLLPAQKAFAMDFMEMAHGVGSFEFSEGGEAAAIDKLKLFLQAMPVQLEFGEHAKKGDGTSASNEYKAAGERIANALNS
ncbi:MAG: hypothetical protein PHE67_02620 [Campylobacterales bacterium]|nr:hypothetical protein [Campylobacterales bacterium]